MRGATTVYSLIIFRRGPTRTSEFGWVAEVGSGPAESRCLRAIMILSPVGERVRALIDC